MIHAGGGSTVKIAAKEGKIRDRVIFKFNVIPARVDVDRHIVYVDIRQKDVDRLHLVVDEIVADLTNMLDRHVTVTIV